MRPLASTLAILVFATTPSVAQQGTAELAGKVLDQSKGVLPGVAIVVTNEETGVFRELHSTAEGSYFVSQIVPGRYRIHAQLDGFRPLDRRNVVLEVGKTTTLDLTLEVGGLSDAVTVTLQPVKSGAPVGRIRSVLLPNGQRLGSQAPAPRAGGAPPEK